jgi:hypothetical protein
LITCLSFSFVSFLFLFPLNWLLVCVVNALIKGRLRTGVSEDWWMVTRGCDEWLTTWCGLTFGRVLQVQVAAWFTLLQVKSGHERSMPCGASN